MHPRAPGGEYHHAALIVALADLCEKLLKAGGHVHNVVLGEGDGEIARSGAMHAALLDEPRQDLVQDDTSGRALRAVHAACEDLEAQEDCAECLCRCCAGTGRFTHAAVHGRKVFYGEGFEVDAEVHWRSVVKSR